MTRQVVAAMSVAAILAACTGGGPENAVPPSVDPVDTIALDAKTPVSFEVGEETQTTPPRVTTTQPATSSTKSPATSPTAVPTSTVGVSSTTLADGSGALPAPSTTLAGGSPGATTTVSPTVTNSPVYTRTSEAMAYVGAVNPVVAPSGDPVVIGFVNQDSGAANFPESRVGARAAIDVVNSSLGGIKGRPVELRECPVKSTADGARCALTLATDPAVQAIVIGSVLDGEAALLDGIGLAKPIILSNPLTLRQFAVQGGVAYTPGQPTLYRGMAVTAVDTATQFLAAKAAASNQPAVPLTNVSVIISDNAAYRNAAAGVLEPALTQLGLLSVTRVPVKAGATFDQASLILAAADLTTSQAILVLGDPTLCAAVASTLATASASGAAWGSVPVVTTEACQGSAMTTYLTAAAAAAAAAAPADTSGTTVDTPLPNTLPEGWLIAGYARSFSPRAAEQQAATLDSLATYTSFNLQPMPLRLEYADSAFSAVLSLTRVLNYLGVNGLTTPRLSEALSVFRGPVWGLDGRLGCGEQQPFSSICGTQIRVVRIAGSERVPANVGTAGIVRPASRLFS